MRYIRILLVLTALVFVGGNNLYAQDSPKPTKQQRIADKKKAKQVKVGEKAEEKAKKNHYAIQSKNVKKRMRRNKHRYDHVDSFDNRPNFIQRIFRRKAPSAY